MDEFKKLLEQKAKEGKKMSEEEKGAKMGVLKELRGMANAEIGRDLPGLKKVTVASNSAEGLQEGLDKAEDVVEELPMGDESEDEEPAMAGDEMSEAKEGSPEYQEACEMAKSLSDDEKMKLIEDVQNSISAPEEMA